MTAKLVGGDRNGLICSVDQDCQFIRIPVLAKDGYGEIIYSKAPDQRFEYLNSPIVYVFSERNMLSP